MPVELHRSHLVDGIAAAVVSAGEVAAGGVEAAVVHELGEHVDPDPRVGVPLGVGVPVGVRDHASFVELGTVGAQQRRQAGDPFAVPGAEVPFGDRPPAVRVGVCGCSSFSSPRPAREHLAHPGLLGGDQLGGGLGWYGISRPADLLMSL